MSEQFRLNRRDLNGLQLPRYIVVEGPIGAGKTALAKLLADTFSYDTLLESPEENPFLSRFYAGDRSAALSAQLFFLMQRTELVDLMRQANPLGPARVADFLMEKDRLIAEATLDSDELSLYEQVYQRLRLDAPKPDLVIYLQATPNVLLERISQHGVAAEQSIDKRYLDSLNETYSRFFHFYDQAPLLIINVASLDWLSNIEDYNNLVRYMLNITSGRHYYNPQAAL